MYYSSSLVITVVNNCRDIFSLTLRNFEESFYPKEKFKSPQRVYSQHSYWEEDLYSVTQLSNVYPSDSNFMSLANLFDGSNTVPTGQITFFSKGQSGC